MTRRLATVLLWLALLALCVAGVTRTRFTADLSAFLPSVPTDEQRLLVDLLRDGTAARLLLMGIEGGSAEERQRASEAMVARLTGHPALRAIDNGEQVGSEADRRWLFEHRYLLSPAVSPERFTAEGLEAAIGRSIDLLASSAGLLLKPLLARDPTGETLQVLDALGGEGQPSGTDGPWVSPDGERALLLATTAAAGDDTDGQQAAIEALRTGFAAVLAEQGSPDLELQLTGPGMFAVKARETIKDQVLRLSLLGASLIVALLLLVYRSPVALLVGLAPVLTGALAGINAVSLGFGQVHGVTLGFGLPLLGEAVDYAIYYFIQGEAIRHRPDFWRTIRTGVLTSLCGFAALLLSGFPGLAQVGLFSITGLTAAVLTTRFVLPALTPRAFRVRDLTPLGARLGGALVRARRLRWAPLALAALALLVLGLREAPLWQHELGALSPVSDADQAVDARLRADLAAPDVRYLVVVEAPDADGALARCEALAPTLEKLQRDRQIGGFDSPARFLPSHATQEARRASLPEPAALRAALETATAALPISAGRLVGFLADLEASRALPPISRASLEGTSMALAVDAMLIERAGRWRALLPVRAAPDATIDAPALRAALADSGVPDVLFVDIKHESERIYASYLTKSRLAALGGVAAVIAVLLLALRSVRRVVRLALPLAAAVAVVIGALALAGERLTLLHLVGMLLVVAVGSNYALFFDAAEAGPPAPRTLASLAVANLTTLAGFGILAFSTVPVLHAIGIVVGPGALLALLFSALLAAHAEPADA